jgi:hypothetical protein
VKRERKKKKKRKEKRRAETLFSTIVHYFTVCVHPYLIIPPSCLSYFTPILSSSFHLHLPLSALLHYTLLCLALFFFSFHLARFQW